MPITYEAITKITSPPNAIHLFFPPSIRKLTKRYAKDTEKISGIAIVDFDIKTIEIPTTATTVFQVISGLSINGIIKNNIPIVLTIDEP